MDGDRARLRVSLKGGGQTTVTRKLDDFDFESQLYIRAAVAPETPDAFIALSLEAAEAGLTLLANRRDLLPLDAGRLRRIAVLGPKARARNCLPLWGGSSGVWPPREITPLRWDPAEFEDETPPFEVIQEDVVSRVDEVRHDPAKLAKALMDLLERVTHG